jgi:hypothetical protein
MINEGIDRSNRIILIDPVIQVFRKQRRLLAIDPLDEAPHPIPRSSPESLCENHTKQGVFTQARSSADIATSPRNVRFSPNNGHWNIPGISPRCARSLGFIAEGGRASVVATQ